MDSLSTLHATVWHPAEPAGIDDGADLMIVIFNESASAGRASMCGSYADYAGVTPAAVQ
ncbi:MAG TPA: hypothetical protein VF070_17100 [Streptosporangiaceae bacterium]